MTNIKSNNAPPAKSKWPTGSPKMTNIQTTKDLEILQYCRIIGTDLWKGLKNEVEGVKT